MVLPVLEKRGINEELRTPRLLKYLSDYRSYRENFFDERNGAEPTGFVGRNMSKSANYDEDAEYEEELLANEKWCESKQNVRPEVVRSPFELINPCSVDISYAEYGISGEPVFKMLASSQVSPIGWCDVTEHMRFRLEMAIDEYEAGSIVSIYGSSAISVCDRNSQVDLLIKIPSLGEKTMKLLVDKKEMNSKIQEISSPLPSLVNINKSQFILTKITECISVTRSTVIEHVNKQKKNIDARSLSKLNADSELICKIGDRLTESSQKEIDSQKPDNSEFKTTNSAIKKLRVSLSNIEKNILLDQENMLNMLGGMVPHIGYHIEKTDKSFGKLSNVNSF